MMAIIINYKSVDRERQKNEKFPRKTKLLVHIQFIIYSLQIYSVWVCDILLGIYLSPLLSSLSPSRSPFIIVSAT